MADRRATGPKLTRRLIEARFAKLRSDTAVRTFELPSKLVRDWLKEIVAPLEARGEDLWLFAYGSLLWSGEVSAAEQRLARVHGFHRRFCLWQWAYRGNVDNPCLMLALDQGGCCEGIVYRVRGPALVQKLDEVWCREMQGDGYRPRWVRAATEQGNVRALAFTINKGGERYAGKLPEAVIADYIAKACGRKGACAEYLWRVAETLDQIGIRDNHLRRLDTLVARLLADARNEPR